VAWIHVRGPSMHPGTGLKVATGGASPWSGTIASPGAAPGLYHSAKAVHVL
jgi:hypothetical protein